MSYAATPGGIAPAARLDRKDDISMGLMEKIFGDLNAKEVRKVEKIVDVIESYDESLQALSDDEVRA